MYINIYIPLVSQWVLIVIAEYQGDPENIINTTSILVVPM